MTREQLEHLIRAAAVIADDDAIVSVQRQHHLDRFAGLWSAEEAAEFDAILAEQRQIDPDRWR